MNITPLPGIPVSALALTVAVTSPAVPQEIEEAPSTVNATYVAESATDALKPGEKIENLYNKNLTQDYVLQRLTDRIWFLQVRFAGTMFYVGDEGVLLIDAAAGHADAIANVPRGTGIENPETVNNHASSIATWIPAIGRYATDLLRPTYGEYYGFEYSTPKNAEMVAWFMFAYR